MTVRAAAGGHLRGSKHCAGCIFLLTAMAALAACQNQEAGEPSDRFSDKDFIGVLHKMASEPAEYATQLGGLWILSALSGDVENSKRLSRALVCRLASSAMNHFPLNSIMQTAAMHALHKCRAMHRGPRVLGLGEREARSLVLEALETFLHDVDTQRIGLAALGTLISPADETEPAAAEDSMMDVCDHLLKRGAAHVVSASMRTHAANIEVVRCALHVMCRLTHSPRATYPLLETVNLGVGALQAFGRDASITRNGIGVLVNLAARKVLLDHFYEAGAWTSAFAAMKQHVDDTSVQRLCLTLAMLLAGHEGLRWQLGEDGACNAVLTSMRASDADVEVQLAGLSAMGSLSDEYTPSSFMKGKDMTMSQSSGVSGVSPWLDDITQETNERVGASKVYAAPDNAHEPHANRIRFVEGGGVEVVALAMRRFPEDANVQSRAVRVLGSIGKIAGGRRLRCVS